MADFKFKFTIQDYQTDAVNSIIKVFNGQPFNDNKKYRRDTGSIKIERNLENYQKTDDELYIGFANSPVLLDENQLLNNIQTIQSDNNIKLSSCMAKHMGCCSLDIEMETGTGKTYVYIKTMFELNKLYGWSKFIVVVPSIAIKEGVIKSFETTKEHFKAIYGKYIYPYPYNSSNLRDIDDFSSTSEIAVIIINTQAFNSFSEDKDINGVYKDKTARIIYSSRDDFGSRRPIDVIKANNPIVILDEPQKMGGERTQNAIKKFNPLFTLNFSATHKEHHDLVSVLDALDAYNMKLVKKIEVKGFDINNLRSSDCYLYLESIIVSPDKPPQARLEFQIGYDNALNTKREIRIVSFDDDLYALSKYLEPYRGYHINDINPISGYVSFTNGQTIRVGEIQGDVSEKNIRRVQIRETIKSHFEKEKALFEMGIKTLSLFFIDKVDNYRKYDEDGNEINSMYGDIFEEEYLNALNQQMTMFNTPYEQYLKSINVHDTHAGYFSIDKKTGHKIDSGTKRGTDISDDESAYDLIMKDKEKLLSFDTPVRFIFSHSALREGWDNPNVFQICTLKHGGDSTTNKRQEVGRGLRICVNKNGDRMDESMLGQDVQEINRLTVIASEGYEDFVSGLQKDIKEDLYDRPVAASPQYFEGKKIKVGDNIVTITTAQANRIYRYLISNEYIDENDRITDVYHSDSDSKSLAALPDDLKDIAEGIHAMIRNIFDENALNDMIKNASTTKIQENKLNNNFYKNEFQTLWKDINHKYTYTVQFDSNELIAKAVDRINKDLYVSKLRYTLTVGIQTDDLTKEKLESKEGFVVSHPRHGEAIENNENSQIEYDLVGKVAEGTHLTRKTIVQILKTINPDKFAMFKANPEEFISRVIKFIEEEKSTMIVDHITYNQTSGIYDSTIFTAEKNKDYSKAYQTKKNVQDYVFFDGYAKNNKPVEQRFAQDLEEDDKVIVYAKLPRKFKIPTPVGDYSPDWAISFKKGTVKHVYFVAETKGTMNSLELRPIEKAKIECAKKLFNTLSTEDLVYQEVDSYKTLLDIMSVSKTDNNS